MLKPCFCTNNPEAKLVVSEYNLTLDLLEIYLPKQYDFLSKMLDSLTKEQNDAMTKMMLQTGYLPQKEKVVLAGDSEDVFSNNVMCIDKGRSILMPWKKKTHYVGVTKRNTLGFVKEVSNPTKHVTIPTEVSEKKGEEVVYYPGNIKHTMITVAPSILDQLEKGEMVQVVSYEQYKLQNESITSCNMLNRTEYNIYLYIHNGKVKADVEMVQYPNMEDWKDIAQSVTKEKDREFALRTTYEVPQYFVNRMKVVQERRQQPVKKQRNEFDLLEQMMAQYIKEDEEKRSKENTSTDATTDRLLKLMLEENKRQHSNITPREVEEGVHDEMGDGR